MNIIISGRRHLPWQRALIKSLNISCSFNLRSGYRFYSHNAPDHVADIRKTRNIGIIAHIDAGKTTTTERMLYYSGNTRRIGDVDEGSTVTDFLPAERARGITIQSAAVTFHWPPLPHAAPEAVGVTPRSQVLHTINLIDTPGHADFTFEVLRSLRILDGAICVLDGVAGVEAQTEKVWTQANEYSIPRIAFVNKLDRDGAAFGRTVREIGSRLRGWPAVCQIPWWERGNGPFIGVGDIVELAGLKWETGGDGKSVKRYSLDELSTDLSFANEVKKARIALVEGLCEFDYKLLDAWLQHDDDALAIPPQDIRDSLRRCIIDGSGRVIPILAGASFRNIGVQPLLDAVNDLLPDPTERPAPKVSLGQVHGTLPDLLEGKLEIDFPKSQKVTKKAPVSTSLISNIEACALAFKVVNDSRRGVLVYIRVYSGILRNAAVWNTNLHVTERAQRLLQMQASDAIEISSIPSGQIGVIAGLKHARTGDTLISYQGVHPKVGPPPPLNIIQLRPIDVPPPVFFTAIEPNSLSEEKNVADHLRTLLREDPSLHVNLDEESGQMQLSGMGELHLEIARDRLVNDFRAKASMGPIEISYREAVLTQSKSHHFIFDRDVAGKKGKAGCAAKVMPLEPASHLFNDPLKFDHDGNAVTISIHMEDPTNPVSKLLLPNDLTPSSIRLALLNGASAALARGPRRGFPMHSTHVILTLSAANDIFGAESTPAAISSAARHAVQAALGECFQDEAIGLMEPVMNVTITCDESSLGPIIHDISSARGGHVMALGDHDDVLDNTKQLRAPNPAKVYAPPDPFAPEASRSGGEDGPGQARQVQAKVPLKEMIGYLKHLRSLTGGRGTFVMSVDRFERVVGHRENVI